jgi:tetratricopeptide (TPR) repeat protein
MELKALVLFDQGHRADALKYHEATLARCKAALGPDHPYTLGAMNNLADNYSRDGRHAEALKLYEQASALSTAKLGPDDPDTFYWALRVARSLMALNRDADAVALVDDCLRRAPGKVSRSALSDMAYLRLQQYEKAKDAAGCRATAEMAEKLNPTDGGCLYTLACVRAVTAAVLRANDQSETAAKAAATEADRAMAWLKQSVAAGYTNIENMKNDKDLRALHGREDFQRLLADLEASNQKDKK